VFHAAMVVFVLASFLIDVAPASSWMIAARALQGVYGFNPLQAGLAFCL